MTSIRSIFGLHNGGFIPAGRSGPTEHEVVFQPKAPISRTTIGSTIVNMILTAGVRIGDPEARRRPARLALDQVEAIAVIRRNAPAAGTSPA